ncbi:MAG: hypothetical protein LAO23_10575 [Acidobacteriia bacterium]|nr:hypothetical protein [Terriglobia bacterium]
MMNQNTLALTGERSSRKQKTAIPNKIISEAGAARIAKGETNIRKVRSALGRASISENHGVIMKIKNIPTHTTTQAE